jgi:hypothetical protein
MDDPGSPSGPSPEPHPLRGVGPSAVAVCVAFAVVGILLITFGKPAIDLHASPRRTPAPSHPSTGPAPGHSATLSPRPSGSRPATPSGSPSPAPPATSPATPSPAPPPPAATAPKPGSKGRVVIFNETTRRELAARYGEQLVSEGWAVTGTGTWRGNVPATTVYYPKGMESVARRLVAEHPEIGRIRPVFPGASTTELTVILAKDFPASIPGATTTTPPITGK